MVKLLEIYGLVGILQLMWFKFKTKLLFPKARIVRFPFRVRGKKFIQIGEGFTTGFNCRIDAFPFKERKKIIKIGKNVQINDDVHIAGIDSIIISDNVLIASKVFITDHNHGAYSGEVQDSPLSIPSERDLYSSSVEIEENVWIGEYVTVLPGVTIGKGSIIGAMSLVNKSIPPFSIAVGQPAKVVKTYNFNSKKWERADI